MSTKKKKPRLRYKVWIHIEGITEGGDVIEGDDYFEPVEVGEFHCAKRARDLQEWLRTQASEGV